MNSFHFKINERLAALISSTGPTFIDIKQAVCSITQVTWKRLNTETPQRGNA